MRAIHLIPIVLAIPVVFPATAEACRPGGERPVQQVVVRPVISQSEAILTAIRQAETAAFQEEATARRAAQQARQQRALAVVLRERARLFPDLDTQTLLRQAVAAERQAKRSEATAQQASHRAQALRSQARELRLIVGNGLVTQSTQFF